MPHNVFYHSFPLQENSVITLSKEEAKHLRVMRLKEKDKCYVIDGKGAKASAFINKLGKEIELRLTEVERKDPPLHYFHLALACMKKAHLELAIEKATELGAFIITIFTGDFSEKKEVNSLLQKRLDALMISALKQSGNLFLPHLTVVSSLSSVCCHEKQIFYGSTSKVPFFTITKRASLLFFIGPEKGFSQEEEKILESRFHAEGVKLAENILRTETAAISASTLSHYFLASLPE